MKVRILVVLPLIVGFFPLAGFGQGNTQRGAVIGGLGGALAGAAIGRHNGDTTAGALIGGAAGLITGSVIGKAQDDAQARQQAYYQQQQAMYQQQLASRAVSTQDVVMMTQNGVDPQLIITQIQRNGITRRIEVSDVIALHQQGVSEPVINALQNAPLAAVGVAAPVYPRPVVVREQYYVSPPPVYYHAYPHHHHWHGYHGGGTHVRAGVVIGR